MQKRSPKRAVDGLLLLNKPVGLSSNQALQRAKYLFQAAKAGHTGSLDPLATGVLPLCLGEATKFSRYLLEADKAYSATFVFGKRSDTGDSEGKLLSDTGAQGLERSALEAVLPDFRGAIEQVPPMYSALKVAGRPLYELARAGQIVEREARKVHIARLEVIEFRPHLPYPELDIEVACSKGTYIRSLAMDIGERLGCGALVTRLHRRRSGRFDEAQCVTLQALEEVRAGAPAEALDQFLLPTELLVADLKPLQLPESSSYYFRQGQPVMAGNATRGWLPGDMISVSEENGRFLGVAEILEDGKVAPRRLMVTP